MQKIASQMPIISIKRDDDLGDQIQAWTSLTNELQKYCAICICGHRPHQQELSLAKDWKVVTFENDMPVDAGIIYIAAEGCQLHCIDGSPSSEVLGLVALKSIHKKDDSAAELRRLRALVYYSDEGTSIINAQGEAIYVSSAAEKILGYTFEEFRELNLFLLLHPDDKDHVDSVLQEAFENPGEPIYGGAARMKRKDGAWRWCEATLTNMMHDPAIGGILDNFRDVTELVEARQLSEYNEKNITALINSTTNAMWSVDELMNLVMFNDAYAHYFQQFYGATACIGMNFTQGAASSKEERDLWKQQYQRVLNGENLSFEHQHVDPKSGKIFWFKTKLTPIGAGGKIYGVAGYSNDFTALEERRIELETLNEKLLLTQRLAKVGYWRLDFASNQLSASDEFCDMMEWGNTRQTITFSSFRKMVHADDLSHFDNSIKNAKQGAVQWELSHRINTSNGALKWLNQYGQISFDDKGKAISIDAAVQDITGQKQIELELAARNDFIETTINNLPLGIAVNEIESGQITFMNKRFCEFYGWPADKLADVDSFFECTQPDPDIRAIVKTQIIDDIMSGDAARMVWKEYTITAQDGEKRVVNAQNIPLIGQGLMVSTVSDVTESAHRQAELIKSKERFEYASKASFDAMWDYDIITGLIFWGAGMEENFGHKFKDSSSDMDVWFSLIHPDDRATVIKGFDRRIANKKFNNWQAEYRMLRANREYAFVSDRGYILRDTKGIAYRMIGAMQDNTEGKEEEIKLRLRDSVISNTKEAVLIAEVHPSDRVLDTIVFANDAFVHMTGLSARDIINNSADILFTKQEDSHCLNHFRKAKKTFSATEFEMTAHHKNGGSFWLSFSMSPVPDNEGHFTHWVFIMRDITERHNYINLLKKQNKHLKEIAYTQSHIVRAPLARLMGLVNVLLTIDKQDEDYETLLSNVKISADELDDIIKNIVGKTSFDDQ